jgi:hypothetical protein
MVKRKMTADSSHTNLKEDPRFILSLREVMKTKDGRYVLRSLLDVTGVRKSTFTGNALSSAHAQGMQNAGLLLEDLMSTAAFELFLQTLKEHYDENVS